MFNSIYEKFIVNLNLEKCLHKIYVIYLKILSKKNKLFLKYNIKTSFSSFNQDTWIIKNIFKYKKNLFFIDVGAYDGISNSNTILFEKFYNWKGLLFEPNKINYKKLLKFRNNSFCHQIVISNFNQKLINITNNDQLSRIEKRGVYKVKNFKLKKYIKRKINLLDIDCEGFEESVITSINFKKNIIDCILIERPTCNIHRILKKNNFIYIKNFLFDYLYVNKSLELNFKEKKFSKLPKKTIYD